VTGLAIHLPHGCLVNIAPVTCIDSPESANPTGAVSERDSYDAWGRRRNPNGTDITGCAFPTGKTTKGFTSQEMMDAVCDVNLNARIYDPTIARFLAADPDTFDEYDLQGLNRYSYVKNEPLDLIDPSGNDPMGMDDVETVVVTAARIPETVIAPINISMMASLPSIPFVMPTISIETDTNNSVSETKAHGQGERNYDRKPKDNEKMRKQGWRWNDTKKKWEQKNRQTGQWDAKAVGPDGRPYDKDGNSIPPGISTNTSAGSSTMKAAGTAVGVGVAGAGLITILEYIAARAAFAF
jgi:RHS repeat-associated protein